MSLIEIINVNDYKYSNMFALHVVPWKLKRSNFFSYVCEAKPPTKAVKEIERYSPKRTKCETRD